MHQYGSNLRTKMVPSRRIYRDKVVLHQIGEFIPACEALSFMGLSIYGRENEA